MNKTRHEHSNTKDTRSGCQEQLPKDLDPELEAVLAEFSERVERALRKLEEAKTVTQEDLQFEVRV